MLDSAFALQWNISLHNFEINMNNEHNTATLFLYCKHCVVHKYKADVTENID